MVTLFEYGNTVTVRDRKDLEMYLLSLWRDHKNLWIDESAFIAEATYQPFLSFDGNEARAANFIGFIHHEDNAIEIYPKVFHRLTHPDKNLMHRLLFFWLSYCSKIRFPANQSHLDDFEVDNFPELIMYLAGRQIHETVHANPYSTYEAVEESLQTPRGRINFNRYTKTLAHANHHWIDCDHEPFVYDNKVNRVIKYCVRLLLSQTRLAETQRILNDIIFLFDEVEDQVCDVDQLNQLKIPALFQEYDDVIHLCRMILANQIYSYSAYEMKKWSLLFPMELIFEDFISGFLKKHFSHDYEIESQKSDIYLHQDPKTFNLRHDILVTNKKTGEQIIIDTKYKPRWDLKETDNKKGVSQTDLYQAVSYAYRRGVHKVILMYPNTLEELPEDFVFKIQKADEKEDIRVKVMDVPFWSVRGQKAVYENLLVKLNNTLQNDF